MLFLKEAAREVASLENAVEREVYTARAAKTAGVTAQAFSIEVKNETEKRRRFEKKRYQREVRAAADAAQPKDRSLHYDNIRSARAEEGLLGLIFADSSLIPELQQLSGDEGGRSVIRAHREEMEFVDVADERQMTDVDTVEDLEKLEQRKEDL